MLLCKLLFKIVKNIIIILLLLYFIDTVKKKFPSTSPDAINTQITSFLPHSKEERLKKKSE